jgi:hypothetical protein
MGAFCYLVWFFPHDNLSFFVCLSTLGSCHNAIPGDCPAERDPPLAEKEHGPAISGTSATPRNDTYHSILRNSIVGSKAQKFKVWNS